MKKNKCIAILLIAVMSILMLSMAYAKTKAEKTEKEKMQDDGYEVSQTIDECFVACKATLVKGGKFLKLFKVGIGQAEAVSDDATQVACASGDCKMDYRAKLTGVTGRHAFYFINAVGPWDTGEWGAYSQSVTKVTVRAKLKNDVGRTLTTYYTIDTAK